jgi:hypothetical protein
MTVRPGGGVDNRYDREYANQDAGDHALGGRKHRTLNQQPDERTDRIFVDANGDSVVVKNDAS